MRAKSWIILTCTIAIAVIAVGTISWFLSNTLYSSSTKESEKLDFLLVDLQGRAFRLSDFRGRIVILDFMAT